MHMADGLLSPVVAGGFAAASALAVGRACRRVAVEADAVTASDRTALSGLLASFVFAAQMINFAIPGTGSSGHLAGGLLLALVLGPHAGLIAITAVLSIQALLFADGGLLALGANIFNLGVIPCLIVHPIVAPLLARIRPGPGRSLLIGGAALAALVAGAASVTLQTVFSGITRLPFVPFLGTMLAVHGAIGLVEGLVTVGVLDALARARPAFQLAPARGTFFALLLAVALSVATVGAWFASKNPDGLEWSLERFSVGTSELIESSLHRSAAQWQERVAPLPDYAFPSSADAGASRVEARLETSTAGLTGGLATLALVTGFVAFLKRRAGA